MQQVISYPFDVIGGPWKLTLPINGAAEIKLPELKTYQSEWFRLNATHDAAVFRARTDGATTSNSSNPRSELREMTAANTNASWSSTSGSHSMEIVQAVNVLPIGSKPVVVTGQIHDASDDISVFRVEGNTSGDRSIASIWITNGNTSHGHLVTNAYKLGTVYRVGFQVAKGIISYTFNGQPVAYQLASSFSGGYFKAGSYNQSGGNITPLADGSADYAEVTIYALQVCHNGVCTGNAAPALVAPAPTATPTWTVTIAFPTPVSAPVVTVAPGTAQPTPSPTAPAQPSAVATVTPAAQISATATPTATVAPTGTVDDDDDAVRTPEPTAGQCGDGDDKDEHERDHADALVYRAMVAAGMPEHVYLPLIGNGGP